LLGDLGKGALAIKAAQFFSGAGASSADCGGVEATALMNGGWLADDRCSLPLLCNRQAYRKDAKGWITRRLILESEVI